MWPAIAAAFSFALIALGVIIYVATDYGRIKIIVDGPNADVQLDGDLIRIRTPRESITLRAGEHELTVKWRDGRFETRKFVVHRGEDEELRVEYEAMSKSESGIKEENTRLKTQLQLDAVNQLVGLWVSDDPNTRGITKFHIDKHDDQILVHAWGKCHPTDCDWGKQRALRDGDAFVVVWDQGFVLSSTVSSGS